MPHLRGASADGRTHAGSTLAAKDRASETREAHAATQLSAVKHMTKKYEAEVSGG